MRKKTEISREEFFNIILEAIRDISEDKDTYKRRASKIKSYYRDLQVYTKEMAEAQAEALYEMDARKVEEEFFSSLKDDK